MYSFPPLIPALSSLGGGVDFGYSPPGAGNPSPPSSWPVGPFGSSRPCVEHLLVDHEVVLKGKSRGYNGLQCYWTGCLSFWNGALAASLIFLPALLKKHLCPTIRTVQPHCKAL